MGRVIHFEIAAKTPSRAVTFYQNVFGWDISTWEGPGEYWLTGTGSDKEPGINGAIMQGDKPQVILTIDVKDIDAASQAVIDAGGKTLTDKSEVMNVGMFRYCEDNEGNKFGIMEAFTPLEQRQKEAMSAREETT
jgi:uncharacterized protein